MRIIVLISLVFLICNSCKKEKDLGSLYDSFIGVWKPIYGSEGDYIEFTKNGHYIYSRGVERQVDFNITKILDFGTVMINGQNWDMSVFSPSESNMFIVYNVTKDTICRYPKKFINENGEVDLTLGNQFFVRQ